MARATRDCPSCGEISIHFHGASRKRVESYADYMIDKGYVCDSCKKAQREKENAKAAEDNKAEGLVELKGTPGQISWAESIRREFRLAFEVIERMALALLEGNESLARDEEAALPHRFRIDHRIKEFLPEEIERQGRFWMELIACAIKKDDAGWWIEHSTSSLFSLFIDCKEVVAAKARDLPTKNEVLEEVSLKPEHLLSKEPVEVNVKGSQVSASMKVFNENFVGAVKRNGFGIWDSTTRRWYMIVDNTMGTVEDRAAQVVHGLLGEGFVVACHHQSIREKALSADFEPIYPRWIDWNEHAPFKGWFMLKIRDENFDTSGLNKIGAKKSYRVKNTWYVRPCEYEALYDIEALHGFNVTDAAREHLTHAEEIDRSRLLIENLPDAPKMKSPRQRPAVCVDGIAAELSDD